MDLVLQVGVLTQGRRPCSVKKNTVAKSEEVKTGYSLAESSKEVHGSKRAVLSIIAMMIYLFICLFKGLWFTQRYYLRHYATSRKVAGSIPDEVDFFN
jgi:hypothetical protein